MIGGVFSAIRMSAAMCHSVIYTGLLSALVRPNRTHRSQRLRYLVVNKVEGFK
jgi:hypothetical protein